MCVRKQHNSFSPYCYLPATFVATGNTVSAGQLLCGGLFSTDSLSNWCAAVALAHALQENATQKEQLLRVQLATSIGNPPVSLLQQCTNILSQVKWPATLGRGWKVSFWCQWHKDLRLSLVDADVKGTRQRLLISSLLQQMVLWRESRKYSYQNGFAKQWIRSASGWKHRFWTERWCFFFFFLRG